jgi:hypothetical protein
MCTNAPTISDQMIELAWSILEPLCLKALRHHADAERCEASAEVIYPLRRCIGHRFLLPVKSLPA